jgi:hypothetical protein
MKDAPIEDRRQGNGNDEHKLPESINKSAKTSDHFTTKTSQHIVKHGKRKANTSIGDPAAKISRGKQNSKYTESTRGKGRSVNTSMKANIYKDLTTTTKSEGQGSRLALKVSKPMTGRTMKRTNVNSNERQTKAMTGGTMKRTNTKSNKRQTKAMTGRTMKRTNTISNERQTRQRKKLVEKSNVERPTTNDNTKARKLLKALTKSRKCRNTQVGNEKNEDKNTQLGNGKNETKEHIELCQDPGFNTLSDKPSINIIRSLNTSLRGFVSTACYVDENTMWIGRQAFGSLMKVKYDQVRPLTIVKEFKNQQIDFYDFCFDEENNQILFCDRKNKYIQSISQSNYKIKLFKCVKPLNPTCITISKKHIFVGLVEEYAYKDPLRPREIIKMDKNGSVCLRIKSTDKTEKKSIFPDRCTINPLNNDLIVSGYESGCKGVVVNFNPEGKLIFTYKEERPFIPFTPRGLTCSPNGNILICNEYNGDVTILDSRLQLIRVIDTVCLNISEKPRGVWWDKVGHLILGTITSENGRIHIADCSDKN